MLSKNAMILDKGLLFGKLTPSEEPIEVPAEIEVIEVDGARFVYSNLDRERRGGFRVPRIWPKNGGSSYYPHWIGHEGFWHPDNDLAKERTAIAGGPIAWLRAGS